MTYGLLRRIALSVAILSTLSSPFAIAQTQSTSTIGHPFAPHVAEASHRSGLPEAWIWAVMRIESGGNRRAVSRAGAIGAMQVMPATWAALRARLGLGADAFDARDNILAGAAYLREMYDRFGSVTAMLAAYNAGPGRYEDHALRGRPLPTETVGYLARLLPMIGASDAAAPIVTVPSWRNAVLFAVRAGDTATDHSVVGLTRPNEPTTALETPAPQRSDGLFVRTTMQVPR